MVDQRFLKILSFPRQNNSVRQNRLDTKLDALMAEYDPRPSRSRRECTLDKLRKALPWPQDAPQVASRGGDEGELPGTRDQRRFHGEVGSGNPAGEVEEGRGEAGRHEDATSDDGYYADDFAGDRRDNSPKGGWREGGEQLPSHTGDGNENNDTNPVVDCAGASTGGGREVVGCQPFGNDCGNSDGDTSSAIGKGDARGVTAGGGGVGSTENGVDAADSGAEEAHAGSPPTPRASPVGGDDDGGERRAVALTAKAIDEIAAEEDEGRASAAGAEGSTKRPATAQRKARRKANSASEHQTCTARRKAATMNRRPSCFGSFKKT